MPKILQKGPQQTENYRTVQMDPDVDAGEQNASMARRRYTSSLTLDRSVPLCGREVFETRLQRASTLHRREHRHRLGHRSLVSARYT